MLILQHLRERRLLRHHPFCRRFSIPIPLLILSLACYLSLQRQLLELNPLHPL